MTDNEAKSVLFDMLGKGIYVKDTKENQAILVALRALERDPCTHMCGYCKYSKVPEHVEPCDSCSIKDIDMTNFIDNFEPKEEKNE